MGTRYFIYLVRPAMRMTVPSTDPGWMKIYFQGLLEPKTKLIPLHGSSYTIHSAVGFNILDTIMKTSARLLRMRHGRSHTLFYRHPFAGGET